ncbi:glycosyltransferase family 2 protein [Gilvibacter sp.]|uniref:glycosyltransferase family 2 protein n=1 Tax=Gilvibacter sp. TaxID=2729997 RepID=UPI0025B968D0|nr:glycosyltransferase family 2 protein [Gilvibacter sp.]NQX76326.1 glycosyltransferase family 2 protein [Gilvibacter sp.]
METLKLTFWILLAVVFYTYVGYGIVLYLMVVIKRRFSKPVPELQDSEYEPEVTLLIPAYNESDYVAQKMKNSFELDYPKDKLKICWVTDGSNDDTPDRVREYEGVGVFHRDERLGKINAMNRVMPMVDTPIVVFSDANTMLGKESIRRIVRKFQNPQVGCVSGEKRIFDKSKDDAAGAGEGLYWKYESTLKKLDAELYSVVGAAGELFAIRTALYNIVEPDTILDDFIISLRVAKQGYTIQYDPEAYAIESASANVKEELKRKIRISAGGIQSVVRLRALLNIFKYKTLSFQYISHRVLRWTITPLCLIAMIPILTVIAQNAGLWEPNLWSFLFWSQAFFYVAAIVGYVQENKQLRIKLLFVPYYFMMMNYSVIMGLFRYLKKEQSVNWERAQRAA